MRAPAWLAAASLVVTVAHESSAQSAPLIKTQVSDQVVEVGQSFRLEFSVLSDSDSPSPSRPRLPNPRAASVQGPSISTQHNVSMVNGRVESRQGFTATWIITPRRVGTLTLGPPSATVGGKTVQGSRKSVKVVEQGQAPQPRRTDPFDFFRRRRGSLFPPGLFNDPFELTPDQDQPALEYPPEYAVQRAGDPIAFLRSRVSPKKAVVGEQVTLEIYAYGNRGRFDQYPFTEPRSADFVSIPIMEDGDQGRYYQVDIGDEVWLATKVRELALFPVRTGELRVGGMKMGFAGRGYSGHQLGLPRTSELLTVRVQEPPLAGRPPGYRVGDVGRFRLKADVTPRKIDQGGAVAVNVTLSGVGNLPTKLEVPQRKGIEWLEPRVTGDLKAEGGVIGGSRHFAYVVRLHESGQIDLGELSLPHYDPKSRSYRPAQVKVGSVEVTADPSLAKDQDKQKDESLLLSAQLKVRTQLGPAADPPWRWTDSHWFWALIGFAPLSVAGVAGSLGLGRRLATLYGSKKRSATTLAIRALGDARDALANGDATRAAAETERAVFLAIEAATGVKARGILREQLAERLTSRGLSTKLAEQATELLARSETARFTGAEADFGQADLDVARGLVRELSHHKQANDEAKPGANSGESA